MNRTTHEPPVPVRTAAGLILTLVLTAGLIGCRSAEKASPAPGRDTPARATEPDRTAVAAAPTAPVKPAREAEALPEFDPLHPLVRFDTTLGDFVVQLDGEQAPATTLNFVQLIHKRFYDGTIFHRVLADSMLQGGGYKPDMERKYLMHEPATVDTWLTPLSNERGTLAMIRDSGREAGPTAEFYINLRDNPQLDEAQKRGIFAVFGRVVQGMDTIERIAQVPVGPHPNYAAGRSAVVPVAPIIIKSVRLTEPLDPIPLQRRLYELDQTQRERANALIQRLGEEAGTEPVETESGIQYVDFRIGDGLTPLSHDLVEFQYRGTLLDGSEFESTYDDPEPAKRKISSLIPGLREALLGMKEGGRRTVVIPPELGFKESGIPGIIPPDSYLVFEIELLGIQ